MLEEERVINDFYSAFQKRDAEGMIVHYHPEVLFEDPAFGLLKGDEARGMWKMLCASASDLKIDFKIIKAEKDHVDASWEALYTFSASGRKVHNKIRAHFEFKDGLILKHTDSFNLHRWASQALGWKGFLLGATSFFKKKLNKQTRRLLVKFLQDSSPKGN